MKAGKIHVVSFSGGRTSAYLVYLMEERRKAEGLDVRYIFMDTGAEHPATYEFIKKVVADTGIDLICLRTKFNPELGKANSYQQISLDDCKHDLIPWRDMLRKYGTPYNPGGAFCTDRMKLVPFTKYCQEHFGEWVTVLGIRSDESRRLKPKDGVVYMADLSDFDKQDVLGWWKRKPFDLGIPEWLGNCVFCIKKSAAKLAIAERDEPALASDFVRALKCDEVRIVDSRVSDSLTMYRGHNSLESVIAMFSDHSRDDILQTMRGMGGEKAGSCSESCEVFNCQLDLF